MGLLVARAADKVVPLAVPHASDSQPLILVIDSAIEERGAWCARLRAAGYSVAEAESSETALALAGQLGPALLVVGRVGAMQERVQLAQRGALLPGAPGALLLLWADERTPAIAAGAAVDFVRLPDDDTFLLHRVRQVLDVAALRRQTAECAFTDQRRTEAALAEANQRLTAIVSAAPIAIATIAFDGTVATWNPAAERTFGWSAAAMIGSTVAPRIIDEATLSRLCAIEGRGLSPNTEIACRRKDGSTVDILVSVMPVSDAGDTPRELLVVAQDISARKEAQAAERDNRALTEAMREIGQALTSTLDPDRLMDLILDNIGRVVPYDAASIMQISGGFGHITHMRGYPPDYSLQIAQLDFPLNLSNLRMMMATGEPIIVGDVNTDPNWLPMSDRGWIQSYCGMPLTVQGEVVGFLNLDSQTVGAFTQAHAQRLQAFAIQVSIAIENARLYDALRRDAVELDALQRATTFLFSNHLMVQSSLEDVGFQIAQTVVKEFGQLDCGVMLIDDTQTRLIRLARSGVYDVQLSKPIYLNGKGLVPAAARTGEVIYAPDVRLDERYVANVADTRSELVLPLRTTKGVLGVLDLQSAQVDAFSEPNRRILMSFAVQAATAIENILLYDRVRRYSADLEARVNERTAELHRVKERVEAILNNSSDAIVMARGDGAIQQSNRAFNLLFQYGEDATFGQALSVLVRPDYVDVLNNGIALAIQEKRGVRLEVVALTAYGTSFDADIVVSPIQERDEAVLSVVCSIRDMTARKRMEDELLRSLRRERELNDLKSRFISTASHEFRTPLSMIMTSSDMLLTYGARLDEAQKKQRLEKIQTEVKNITVLLDDLLMISRASQVGNLEFNPTRLDLAEACRTIVDEVRTGVGADHEFQVTITGDHSTARVDSKLLKRMLMNLLSNAVKYSPRGSTILFNLSRNGDSSVIQIQDQGIGIPDADQKNLFEAFHRGSNVGTVPGMGLGLTIVKHAIELHSGTIDVHSRDAAGTTFTSTLPVLLPKEDAYEKNSGH